MLAAVGLGVVLAAAACGVRIAMPDDSAPPDVVLRTYLAALVAGDCQTAHALARPTFVKGNGELCADLTVSAVGTVADPARPSAGVAEYGVELTTSGSSDGSIVPGRILWFYELDRQPDGRWRLVGGGSGP